MKELQECCEPRSQAVSGAMWVTSDSRSADRLATCGHKAPVGLRLVGLGFQGVFVGLGVWGFGLDMA